MMGGGGGGGGGQQNDNSYGPLWMLAFFFVFIIVIWYKFHAEIVYGVLVVKLYEAYFVSIFTSDVNQQIIDLQNAINNPGSVSFNDLMKACADVGIYIAWPMAVIMVLLAIVIYFGAVTLRFKRTYTMESLINEEYVNWPQVTPILKLNLVDTNIEEGPWAMSPNPLEFSRTHKLLREDTRDVSQGKVVNREGRTMMINRGEAMRTFTIQLGPYWRGHNALPAHTRALFAAFAARINHDVDSAAKLFADIGSSTKSGELNFKGADAILDKYINTKDVQQVIHDHAFVLTVMASMLEKSRDEGVMAVADFIWLKPVDRPLWYVLSTVGRQTAFAEIAGVAAHWRAEKEVGRRLYVPMVEEAVNGLEASIKNSLYNDKDYEDEKQEKQ